MKLDIFIEKYIRWIIKNKWAVFGAVFFLLLASLFSLNFIKVDFSAENFFPHDNQIIKEFRYYSNFFPGEDRTISVFIDHKGPVNARLLKDMKNIEDILKKAGLTSLYHLGNAPKISLSHSEKGFYLKSQPLFPENLSDRTFYQKNKKELDSPFIRGIIINPGTSLYPVHGVIPGELNHFKGRIHLIKKIKKALKPLNRPYYLLGYPVLRSEFTNLILLDQLKLVPIAILIGIIILFIYFRNLYDIIISYATILAAVLVTLSLLAVFSFSFNNLFTVTPLIIIVVGLSDMVHTLIQYKNSIKNNPGLPHVQIIIITFQHTVRACFLTSITTAIGFLSLLFTNVASIQQFALITAAGIMILYLFFITLFPLLLLFNSNYHKKTGYVLNNHRLYSKLFTFTVKHKRKILALFILLFVGMFFSLFRLETGGVIVDDLKKDNPIYQNFRKIEKLFGAIFTINLLIEPVQSDLFTPENLFQLSLLEKEIKKHEGVQKVLSPLTLYREFYNKTGNSSRPFQFKDSEVTLFKTIINNTDYNLLKSVYDGKTQKGRMIIFINDVGFNKIKLLTRHIAQTDKKYKSMKITTTGTVLLMSTAYDIIINNFLKTLFIAIAVIFLILLLSFKSFKLALLALIPNFFPLFFVLAILGLFKIEVKPSNILVFNVIFGLAVDDTIHLISWTDRQIKQHKNSKTALLSALTNCSPAIIMTSIGFSAGFSILMFSSFINLFYMGLLLSLSLLAALAADLFLTPVLLLISYKEKPTR